MITLSTKTFGKKAKREILKHLPTAKTLKKVAGYFIIRDNSGKMLGHVSEGNFHSKFATLTLAKN
jgi:hypothetical protein